MDVFPIILIVHLLLALGLVGVVLLQRSEGGALGIGVGDKVAMLEHAYYSVISPEGCAAILWKHRRHAPEAAEALKLGARDLKELNLVDEVIAEPLGGAHRNAEVALAALGDRALHGGVARHYAVLPHFQLGVPHRVGLPALAQRGSVPALCAGVHVAGQPVSDQAQRGVV